MGRFDDILIVSDVDDTFLAKGGALPPNNIDSIKYFLSEGGKFTFATGRVHQALLVSIPAAKEIVNAPGIMTNGAYIYDFENNEMLQRKFLNPDDARKVAEFVFDYNDEVGIRYSSISGTSYCRFPPDYLGDYEKRVYKDSPLLPKEQWHFADCYKIVVRGKSEELDDLRSAIELRFGDLFELVKSGEDFLEIQKKGCTKGAAIDGLREYYQQKGVKVKIYACGDYENDLSMLKKADVAVCPSNACKAVKDICDMVLCHCNEGLIAYLINQING